MKNRERMPNTRVDKRGIVVAYMIGAGLIGASIYFALRVGVAVNNGLTSGKWSSERIDADRKAILDMAATEENIERISVAYSRRALSDAQFIRDLTWDSITAVLLGMGGSGVIVIGLSRRLSAYVKYVERQNSSPGSATTR